MSLISWIISLLILGLIAGFSFMLYAAQIAILSSETAPIKKGFIFAAGAASGVALLAVIFLFMQPEMFKIDLVWSIFGKNRTYIVDVIIGFICILGGLYVLTRSLHRDSKAKPGLKASKKSKAKLGGAALFGLSFGRSITRVSGIAALLLGVRLVIHATDSIIIRALLVALLLAAAILPYVLMIAARAWRPSLFLAVEKILSRVKNFRPYRLIGSLLLVMGCAFFVLSFMPMLH
jgi:MFS family permease